MAIAPLASLGSGASGDALYRFDAPELKAVNHRLDGVFWQRSGEAGTAEQPVVLLEVQKHAKPGFNRRLFAQTARFLQLYPQVQYLEVVVVAPHRRLKLGPAQIPRQPQAFLYGAIWLSRHCEMAWQLAQSLDPGNDECNCTSAQSH